MATLNHSLPGSIADLLTQIRNLYNDQFDRTWFTSALRDFPMEARQLADIRHALTLTAPTVWDLPVLHRGVAALEIYVRLVRQTILPRSAQIFGYGPGRPGYETGEETRLHRRLVVYTLPLNLDRLTAFVRELRKQLPEIPSTMPSLRTLKAFPAVS